MDILELNARNQYARRKARQEHPNGRFDKGGRFYPAPTEARECCRSIRTPSRRWPYTLMLHCRSLKHIRQLQRPAAGGLINLELD